MAILERLSGSTTVTGRKLAASISTAVRHAYSLDPRDGVRSVVAHLGTEQNRTSLLELAHSFSGDPDVLRTLGLNKDLLRRLDAHSLLRGAAVPRPVHRLPSPEHHGYPLRRTLLVTFNQEPNQVTAELREVRNILRIRGVGTDDESALEDLARQFDKLVREKVRVPPHARKPGDGVLITVVNYLVDWDQFRLENPVPRLLWGQLLKRDHSGLFRVRWLLGPGGVRDQTMVLSAPFQHPRLYDFPEGCWFRAVVKEYPDRVAWVETPSPAPVPDDPEVSRQAWEALPILRSDQPDVWPLEGD